MSDGYDYPKQPNHHDWLSAPVERNPLLDHLRPQRALIFCRDILKFGQGVLYLEPGETASVKCWKFTAPGWFDMLRDELLLERALYHGWATIDDEPEMITIPMTPTAVPYTATAKTGFPWIRIDLFNLLKKR